MKKFILSFILQQPCHFCANHVTCGNDKKIGNAKNCCTWAVLLPFYPVHGHVWFFYPFFMVR